MGANFVHSSLVIYALFFVNSSYLICAQPFDYPTANLSTSWINTPAAPHSVSFADRSTVRAILLRGSFGPKYACGFFCNGNCDSYLFAIFIVQTNSGSGITSPSIGFPKVVWSANRNNPVKINATLQLKSDGDLVLRDTDGSIAWSSNTSGRSVAGLNLTESGNLVLFDGHNSVVWQSFDYPTDSLVPGQKLMIGRKLTASVSDTNWTQAGLFSLLVTNKSLSAYLESDPPLAYYQNSVSSKENAEQSYARFVNGSLALYLNSVEPSQPSLTIPIPQASSAQYMRLGPDGHLRVYEWASGWKEVADLLTGYLGDCSYPLVCGKYGICSSGQCSCPGSSSNQTSYFRQITDKRPDLGCSEVTPVTCSSSQYHSFLELKDVNYFTFNSSIDNTDIEKCKQACFSDCNCKAALFHYGTDPSSGSCYLPSQIFSLMNNDQDNTHLNSTAFLKVQIPPSPLPPSDNSSSSIQEPKKKNDQFVITVGSPVGGVFLLILIIGLTVFMVRKNRKAQEVEEDYLDQVPGMPTRFSYEDLKAATENFSKKLGEGGFGSVFEGTLKDGTTIAVKCLDGVGQVKKSFLAEVESIGSIHHVNLVRLIGFCADKSNRLLVYEYMCNGSLDKWIYHQIQEFSPLDWKSRRKIILDVAKGLSYLHEDCRQKIIHLDIKPQNILLDEEYNAKVSDFGLSKLIDRNQSQVVTTMRGTPGYLAPEWLSSGITEKVDVYSFGIMVLETLCGRKNIDISQPEESIHLLSLFQKSAEEGRLLDLVDNYSEDMQSHGEEVMEMMKIAAWCLHSDFAKRPSMSVVVKVLDGVMPVVQDINSIFLSSALPEQIKEHYTDSTPLVPSVLSGPR